MNDECDPLEEELARYRPEPISPELRQRIGDRLAGMRRWRLRFPAMLGAAAALAAACVMWWVSPTALPPERIRPAPPQAAQEDNRWPTFAAYHRALNESPQALEELVDRQAALACRGEVAPLTRFRAEQDESFWKR
jgi:hypothetical protein